MCLDETFEDAVPGEDPRLTYPCNCASPVHIGCLERWRSAQKIRALREGQNFDEWDARASTCEICGARLILDGARPAPLATSAICRAHGGLGQVALRRVPTLSRAERNFSEYSATEGQQLEVLEQDASGEFFRVRALQAKRYKEEGSTSVAEGWIRHTYLEWPQDVSPAAKASVPAARMPPAYRPVAAKASASAPWPWRMLMPSSPAAPHPQLAPPVQPAQPIIFPSGLRPVQQRQQPAPRPAEQVPNRTTENEQEAHEPEDEPAIEVNKSGRDGSSEYSV